MNITDGTPKLSIISGKIYCGDESNFFQQVCRDPYFKVIHAGNMRGSETVDFGSTKVESHTLYVFQVQSKNIEVLRRFLNGNFRDLNISDDFNERYFLIKNK
jgi:hypothetical protein